MEKKLKKKKLLIVTIIILVAILIWVVVSECVYNPKLYSDEKHMENIERIAENNYQDTKKYSIEPLYNSKEKLEGVMILHKSGGYTLVMIIHIFCSKCSALHLCMLSDPIAIGSVIK